MKLAIVDDDGVVHDVVDDIEDFNLSNRHASVHVISEISSTILRIEPSGTAETAP